MTSKTDVVVILDRSGSMCTAKDDHEGGLRSFIEDQKKIDGDVYFTFVRFDSHDPFELVYDREDINDIDVANITLTPRGGTPLLDAVGSTIEHLEKTIKKDTDTVLVMVITDGFENSSRKFNTKQIKDMIDAKKDRWTFMYLGANVDEFAEGGAMNFDRSYTAGFVNTTGCTGGVQATYGTISSKFGNVRSMHNVCYSSGSMAAPAEAVANVLSFTDDERNHMKGN